MASFACCVHLAQSPPVFRFMDRERIDVYRVGRGEAGPKRTHGAAASGAQKQVCVPFFLSVESSVGK